MISVIVPVYNVDKYLNKCINSILGQTYKDFELILVNDGSTDNSPKICDMYARQYKNVQVTLEPQLQKVNLLLLSIVMITFLKIIY